MRTLTLLAIVLAACSGGLEPVRGCGPEGGIRPVCGFQNPEDLAVVPGGEWVLVSEMGTMDGERPGHLALFRPADETRLALFPAGGGPSTPDVAAGAPAAAWGADDCPGPPGTEFSPHGLDLALRPDGRLQLLVVNHGGRESIEFFEVTRADAGPDLVWRGCAVPPEPAFLNDVAALPDGGFVTTHMFPRGGGVASMLHFLRGQLGFDTGHVLEWQAGRGFQPVPGTEAPMPNGIAVSPDGKRIYLNAYLGDEVRRVARDGSEPPASACVPRPDNVTWSDDGRLLVASHRAGMREMLACSGLEGAACPVAFAIVALDPETLEQEVVFQNAGAPMGGGTVAVQLGDELLIGSFAGDRIARVDLER